MCRPRAAKIAGIANDVPEQAIEVGSDSGKLLVLGWGSTYGAIREAVERCRSRGLDGLARARALPEPLPRNLGDLLRRFDRVLVPELNLGQLVKMIRSQYMIPAESLPKVQGKPFTDRRARGQDPKDAGELRCPT